MRLARIFVAVAAFVAAAVLVPSTADAHRNGGGWSGGWHGGGAWHGGHWHGGYYRPCCYGGYWPFWGGVAIGASVGYWGGYWGGYYPYYPAYYYPAWGSASAYSYDAPPGTASTYSQDNARGGGSGQPVPQASQAAEPIFYPRNGQSSEQTEQDRRDCNRWATTQRGAMADASIFQRATFACMEGRGYTVR